MGEGNHDGLFDVSVWRPALEKYGAVTHLTVALYDTEGQLVCEPVPATPLFALFQEHGYEPGILSDCARQCLVQTESRPAVVVAPAYGFAVVGTSLLLEGEIVGAAVAGYALVDFCQSTAIAALARHAGVPFKRLWDLAQQLQPIPQRRLLLHGELLQVLGDTILRENLRTRQYEETSRRYQETAHRYEEIAARLKTEMAAKDEFLAVLSHELRTPLTPILGWVRILKEAGDSPAQRRKAADSIERNAMLEVKLVDDLLDLNRVIRDKVPSLDIAVHDLVDVLRSVRDTMADAAASRKIDIEYIEPNEPLMIEGDTGRLQQIFANVLSNAVKFSASAGRVRMTATRDEHTAIVRITDTGEGIPAEFLPHVFEMFRQQEEGTRRRHSGLGIGLALVKRLVELHEGRVDIASAGVGHGTEVTIRLPLSDARAARTRKRLSGADDFHFFSSLTILVVEDIDDSLEATLTMLRLLGARVLAARDGIEALEVLQDHNPDLVLCDLRMPRMDGFEFLRELIRTRGTGHPPVVAVTALVTEKDQRRTAAAGFEGHLNKPFDSDALVSAVRSTLSERRTA
jgi:signal transduction histidine kinase/ActR/RegA family two-component response regulator